MPNMKGGEYIVDFLIREGVPYVFGVCGHGNVGILDAMYERQSEIKLISPRHEQPRATWPTLIGGSGMRRSQRSRPVVRVLST